MSGGTSALEPNAVAQSVSSTPRWSILLGAGMIVLAALATYHNSFAVPFLLDDRPSIIENPKIQHLWPVWDAFRPLTTSTVGGRPIVNFSFALNYAFGSLAVWGYHALNLAIHVFAGLTLFGIVRRTLIRPSLRERFGASAVWLALAVAVLWTVHPLQTEAVTYISERAESLMGLFYLMTLYWFIRGAEPQRDGPWFVLSVMTCLLGMATKEVMVTAPLMVLLYDRTFVSGSFREAWTRHSRLYVGLASTWLLLGYEMIGLRYRAVGYGYGVPWWAYALTECRAVTHYLRLALWPQPLVFDYGAYVNTWHVADVASSMAMLALLVVAVLLALKWRPIPGFLGAWFFVILAPASSVIPVASQPVAEHRMYLPLAAVVAVGVMGINALLGRRGGAAFLALAVGLGFLTIRRNEDYRTELSIWNDTVAKRPGNVRARSNLGLVLFRAGKVPEAIDQYEQAVAMDPHWAIAHNDLGNALRRVGRVDEAIAQYQQALQIEPDFFEAHYDLAATWKQAGRLDEAIQQYRQAVKVRPDVAMARNNLGNALLQAGKVQEAIGQFEQALRIAPAYCEAHNNLGNAFLQSGNLTEAASQYRQALEIQPDDMPAHYNLGMVLAHQGKVAEAIPHLERALELAPNREDIRRSLDEVRRAGGKD
jgi:tetratricopeptide (TPR) repeat protein